MTVRVERSKLVGCDCRSYNGGMGEKPEIVLPRPWFLEGSDERPNGVPVDACLADVVRLLWANRIVTLSSCCGHGRGAPSLVMGSGEDWKQAAHLIDKHDGRPFTLYQWQLVELDVERSNE